MFNDVSNKLKLVAKIIGYGGIVLSCLAGLIFFIVGITTYLEKVAFLIGLAIALVGSVLSWVSSLFIYAFAEMNESITYTNYIVNKAIKDNKDDSKQM